MPHQISDEDGGFAADSPRAWRLLDIGLQLHGHALEEVAAACVGAVEPAEQREESGEGNGRGADGRSECEAGEL